MLVSFCFSVINAYTLEFWLNWKNKCIKLDRVRILPGDIAYLLTQQFLVLIKP